MVSEEYKNKKEKLKTRYFWSLKFAEVIGIPIVVMILAIIGNFLSNLLGESVKLFTLKGFFLSMMFGFVFILGGIMIIFLICMIIILWIDANKESAEKIANKKLKNDNK